MFGTEQSRATGEIALVGDSHAGHWRAAVNAVAIVRGWHGTSITLTGCPLTTAAVKGGERRASCHRWTSEVMGWFHRHPEVHTVIVSARARFRLSKSPGKSAEATRVAGYLAAWRALPATVTRILVLRDTPLRPLRTLDCVEHEIAVHGDAGAMCPISRDTALPQDPAVLAARRLGTARVGVIDMTAFFCSASRCPPVIGGALVNKDDTHMTTVYAESLAPYLMKRLDALISPRTAAAPVADR
jgi:hypothetical protein